MKGAHNGNSNIFIDFVTTSNNSCLKKLEYIKINKRAKECAESKSGL